MGCAVSRHQHPPGDARFAGPPPDILRPAHPANASAVLRRLRPVADRHPRDRIQRVRGRKAGCQVTGLVLAVALQLTDRDSQLKGNPDRDKPMLDSGDREAVLPGVARDRVPRAEARPSGGMCRTDRRGRGVSLFADARPANANADRRLDLWPLERPGDRRTHRGMVELIRRARAMSQPGLAGILASLGWRIDLPGVARQLRHWLPCGSGRRLPLLCIFFGGVVAIALFKDEQHGRRSWLSAPPLRFFGRYSDGIYVLHYPIQSAFEHAEFTETALIARTHSAKLLFVVVNATCTIGAARLSWSVLGRPILRL